jgi:hypothetical protein
MLPSADQAVEVTEALARRFPRNSRYAWGKAFSKAQHAYALVRAGQTESGFVKLANARQEIENLVQRDPENDQFLMCRSVITAIGALSFAAWAEEKSTGASERLERLSEAEKRLAQAEKFYREVKSKEAELYLVMARSEFATTRGKFGMNDTASLNK